MQRRIKNQVVHEYAATGEDGAVLELTVAGPTADDVVKVVMVKGDVATLRFHNRPCVHEIRFIAEGTA